MNQEIENANAVIEGFARVANATPLLDPEAERALGLRVLAGDANASRRLVDHNLRLVLKAAHKHAYGNRPLIAELIQVGSVGLCEAAQTFDPDKGRFSTHATIGIRGRILRFIMTTARIARVAVTTDDGRRVFWNLGKVRSRLEAQGLEATPEAVARELEIDDPEAVGEIMHALSGHDVSTHAPVKAGEEDHVGSFGDTLAGDIPDPEAVARSQSYQDVIRERINAFRETLSPKQRIVLDMRIATNDPATLEETGQALGGSSREAARQIEKRVKDRIQLELDDVWDEILDDAK